MNFAVNREHRDFFRNHRRIECEDLLTEHQQAQLVKDIATVLSARLTKSPSSVFSTPENELFKSGRDLWRGSPQLKKIILNRSLAEMASEILETKPLRFGYDQLWIPPSYQLLKTDAYSRLLDRTATLQELSCIQGVLCGLMLCLSDPKNIAKKTDLPESILFPGKPGNGVVFSPDLPLPLSQLGSRHGFIYLMLVYTQSNAVYCLNEGDPHVYDFKQLGYNLGDRLTEKLNPLVYG